MKIPPSDSQSTRSTETPASATAAMPAHASGQDCRDSTPPGEPAAAASDYFRADKRDASLGEWIKNAIPPLHLMPRDWRQERRHMAAVFFLTLILYAITMPHTVTLENDGLFIANLEFFGVASPPGYPLHTFLGGIFYHALDWLALGSPAFRAHLFSGFAAAAACAAIYALIRMLVSGRVFGYLGALAYGASKTFWSQAIIAEVYTLNAMLFFIILALCLVYAASDGRSQQRSTRLLYLMSFIYGLGLANHYPLLLLGSSGLALLIFSPLCRQSLPTLIKAAAMLMLGAVPPYLLMVWRSYDLTPANFYGAIETPDQFLFYVMRSGYAGVYNQAGVTMADKITFASQLADEMLWQFTPVGFFFVLLGFLAMSRSRHRRLWLALTVSWLSSGLMLVFLIDYKASFIWLATFRAYYLLAYGIMAIWLAIGAAWSVEQLRYGARRLPPRPISTAILLAVVGSSLGAHWAVNNRYDYRWAHDLAAAKISSLEPDAELFLFDDLDVPVGYLHYVEGVRPDLTVYNDQGLVYGNRLYSPLLSDHPPPGNPQANSKTKILRDFIEQTERPIYYHPQRRELYRHSRYGSDFTGFFRRVNRENRQERIILTDPLREWLNDNVGIGDQITDSWTRQQHYSTVAQLVGVIVTAQLYGVELDASWLEVIERARENNAQARLITAAQYLNAGQMSNEKIQRELDWSDSYDIDSEELLDAPSKSTFFLLRAEMIRRRSGKEDEGYEAALQEAMKRHPSGDNQALALLLNLYDEQSRYCELIALTDQYYPQADDIPDTLLRLIQRAQQQAETCARATWQTTAAR